MKKTWIILGFASVLLISMTLRSLYFSHYPSLEVPIHRISNGEMSYDYIGLIATGDNIDDVTLKLSKLRLNSDQVTMDLEYKFNRLKYKKIDIDLKLYEKEGNAVLEFDGIMIDDKNNTINYNRKFEYDFSLHKIEVRDLTD